MPTYMACPQCQKSARLKHYVSKPDHVRMWFACPACRNHFMVMRYEGQTDKILAESPRNVPAPTVIRESGTAINMSCPGCGRYGNVKMTTKRHDGYWRRHQCPTCGPYYTCETRDGVSVHQKLKSLKTREFIA